MNVPRIRFKGFTDAWTQRKLGEVAEITKLAGFEFTKYIVYSDEGKFIALRGLNIKNGELILDDVKYIDESDFSKLSRSKLFKYDILFTYVGTVGQLAIIPVDEKYYLAPNVARIRVTNNLNPEFVCQQMGGDSYYRKTVLPLIATSSQPALSMENIRKFKIDIPTLPEQTSIGNFFRTLDDIVTLQQRKLDKLRELKRGYLQVMFPQKGGRVPRVRFAGFSGDWVERKLGEVVEINPRSILPESFEYVDLEAVVGTSLISHCSETKNRAPSRAQRLALKGDIFYQMVRPYQKNNYYFDIDSDNYVFSTGYAQLRPKINGYFLFSKLQGNGFVAAVLDQCTGTSYPAITTTALKEIGFHVSADNSEQTAIGNFFRNLDKQIAAQQVKLDKLKRLKAAYLQRMFI